MEIASFWALLWGCKAPGDLLPHGIFSISPSVGAGSPPRALLHDATTVLLTQAQHTHASKKRHLGEKACHVCSLGECLSCCSSVVNPEGNYQSEFGLSLLRVFFYFPSGVSVLKRWPFGNQRTFETHVSVCDI